MKVHFSSKKMDWETPHDLFNELDHEFNFTLDVCADEFNFKCVTYLDEEVDGLSLHWDREGSNWMNPPYGREIINWMKKAYEESLNGSTVVCLVPSRTDTKWWHEYAMKADEIRYIKGRLKFVGAKHSAPFPSAIVIFRGKT